MSASGGARVNWRKPHWLFFAAASWAALAVSCSGTAPDDETQGDTSSGGQGGNDALGYCDVSPILDMKCRRCHSDPTKNGAPFSLEGFDPMAEEYPPDSGKPRSARMSTVIQDDFMPYRQGPPLDPPVEDLTADEEAKLVEWLDAGAPRGSGECE